MTQVVRVLGQILNQKRATSEIALIAARDLSGNLMPDMHCRDFCGKTF